MPLSMDKGFSIARSFFAQEASSHVSKMLEGRFAQD